MKSIKFKLISILLLLLAIPSLIICLVSYENSKNSLEESGEKILKNSVESAIQLMNALNEGVKNGDLTLDEAQEMAKKTIIGPKKEDGTREIVNPVDLGDNGYLYVIGLDGEQVASPSVEGQNLWDKKDKNGKLFIQEKIEKAKSGGGFTTFYFILPNNKDEVAEKISYSELYPEWGWVVAAGTYKMDFNKPANELLYVLLITFSVAIIIGSAIALLFSKHLANPITELSRKVNEVATGNFSISLDELKRKDEIGSLNISFNQMVHHLKSLIGNVENSINEIHSTSLNLTAVAEETTASGDEIARAIEEVSRGSVQQASDADDTNQVTVQFANQIIHVHEKNNHMLDSSQVMQLANEKGLENIHFLKEKSVQTFDLINHVQQVIDSLIGKVKILKALLGLSTIFLLKLIYWPLMQVLKQQERESMVKDLLLLPRK
ncbi:cache domain-containing protein [Bacillus sp. Bva_UNVM-123]|uniref:cache domain-containing protein n=1 Tax=Bacillus sp. Bva_UNVM-123 TaxID=2829798 RepID=UPI00391F8CEA